MNLNFSSSDNTDPRTNGKMYTYRIDSQSTSPPSQSIPTTTPSVPTTTPSVPTTTPSVPTTTPSVPTTTPSVPTTTPIVSTGKTFYVSPSGSDSNAGTISAPWRTVTAAALKLAAGDTAILLDGIYQEPQVLFANSGTASKPITVRAQNKWGAVIASTSGCNPAISIYKSYITIDGLRFSTAASNVPCPERNTSSAIRCWESTEARPNSPTTGTQGCTIRNVYIEFSTARAIGIKTNQDFTLVENSVISSSTEAFNNTGTIFRNNTIYGADSYNDYLSGKGGVRDLQLYNNVIHLTGGGGTGISLGGWSGKQWLYDATSAVEAYNAVAYNNVVINESGANYLLLGMCGCHDCTMSNNVVIGGPIYLTLGSGVGEAVVRPTNRNPRILNNIVLGKGGPATGSWTGWEGAISGTLTMDHNNFSNVSAVPTQAHPVVGNPSFINPASDWHVQAGSPTLKSGMPVNVSGFNGQPIDVSPDKDGNIRSAPWNLGPY